MDRRGDRINIGGNNLDPNYRYHMARMKSTEEGKGNGVRTVILNMKEVAKDLKIPPEYPTKWFGYELGAISKYDTKTGFASLNGRHTSDRLAKLLDIFIDIYVLCPSPNCKLPETDMYVKKDIIKLDCRACGYHGNVDMSHRLTKIILSSPPSDSRPKKGKGTDKADKQPKITEELSSTNRNFKSGNGEDADEIGEELAKEIETMEAFQDDGLEEESTVEKFRTFVTSKERTNKEITDELAKLQKNEAFSNKTRLNILFETLFDKNIKTKLQSRLELIKQYVVDSESQADLLGSIEKLCFDDQTVIKIVPGLLQYLYENNVLEEDSIITWYNTVSFVEVDQKIATYIRKSAEPFVTWLRTAEAESDEDDANKE